MGLVGVSSGTAAVLGLKKTKNDTLPTTAYLLLGTGCRNHCHFCPQGAANLGERNFLSRITWPQFEWAKLFPLLVEAAKEGKIKRVCFQVTDSGENFSRLVQYGEALTEKGISVNSSCVVEDVEKAKKLMEIGFEKISLALDAATPKLFRKIKGRDWDTTWRNLNEFNMLFPGRLSTHLIVGMGETHKEMIEILFELLNKGITVGLFAFTPIKGTPMALEKPPEIEYYRKIQVARHLFMDQKISLEKLSFFRENLVDWGYSTKSLINLIKPDYFRTAGCKDCNRPYYNERPSGVIYNYPRELNADEFIKAIKQTLANTKQEGTLDEETILETYNRWTS